MQPADLQSTLGGSAFFGKTLTLDTCDIRFSESKRTPYDIFYISFDLGIESPYRLHCVYLEFGEISSSAAAGGGVEPTTA